MKKSLLFILILVFAATSCKKTVESEQKAWESNLRRANQLTFEFPNFTNLIKEQIDLAQKIMNDASSITDEKLKIEKMAEANVQVMKGFVRNLEDIKSIKTGIRKKSTDARGLKAQYNEMTMINQAIFDGERVILESDSKIKTIVNSRPEADSLTGLVLTDMKNAESNLDRAIAVVKDRVAAEKAKIEETQKQLVADKAAKEKSEAPIICKYCGTSNLPTAVTCKGCGASLK